MEHLRRYSCFFGHSVRQENSCSISSKPTFQAFAAPFFSKWNWFVQMVNAIPGRNLPLLNLDYHLPKPWTDCLCAKSCIRLHLFVLRHELQVTLGPTHPETEVKHLHRETWTCVAKQMRRKCQERASIGFELFREIKQLDSCFDSKTSWDSYILREK